MTRKEEEKHLLKKSKNFLETAEYQISKGFYDLATFSLEQTLELFLKSKILAEGADYPRTHSVRALLELLLDLVSQERKQVIEGVLDCNLLELGMLEDAYITSRYIMREFNKQETQKLAKAVKDIIENVK